MNRATTALVTAVLLTSAPLSAAHAGGTAVVTPAPSPVVVEEDDGDDYGDWGLLGLLGLVGLFGYKKYCDVRAADLTATPRSSTPPPVAPPVARPADDDGLDDTGSGAHRI